MIALYGTAAEKAAVPFPFLKMKLTEKQIRERLLALGAYQSVFDLDRTDVEKIQYYLTHPECKPKTDFSVECVALRAHLSADCRSYGKFACAYSSFLLELVAQWNTDGLCGTFAFSYTERQQKQLRTDLELAARRSTDFLMEVGKLTEDGAMIANELRRLTSFALDSEKELRMYGLANLLCLGQTAADGEGLRQAASLASPRTDAEGGMEAYTGRAGEYLTLTERTAQITDRMLRESLEYAFGDGSDNVLSPAAGNRVSAQISAAAAEIRKLAQAADALRAGIEKDAENF